jgi:hypothetical protein
VTQPGLGERIERSAVAQILIAAAIVLILVAQVATHLPDSAIRDEVGDDASYFTRLTGTEQQWGVFAPNPRSTSLRIEGRVTFEDGSTAVWHLPEGPRVGANLRYYRWRKWLERVRSNDYRSLWDPTARWIAGLYDDGPSPVEKVELVRMFRENRLRGEQPRFEEVVYWTYRPDAEGG